MKETYKYGIDFGTTNSSISVVSYDATSGQHIAVVYQVEDFQSDDVNNAKILRETLRSIVSVETKGNSVQTKVGLAALEYRNISDNNPIKRIKMRLLNEYNCKDEIVLSGYQDRQNEDDYRASKIIAAILKRLKEKADLQLPKDIRPDGAVIGVPIDIYKDDQKNKGYKKVLYTALTLAGFYKSISEAETKTVFIDEPIAVAYSYAESKITKDKKVLIFDFGGGTLDIAIVQMRAPINGKYIAHEVLGKGGRKLGGEQLTFDFFETSFLDKYGTRYEALKLFEQFGMTVTRATAVKEVRQYLEDAEDNLIRFAGVKFFEALDYVKCQLSKYETADFSFRFSEASKNIVFNKVTFSREDFNVVLNEYLPKIKSTLNNLFTEYDVLPDIIDEVLLAGGSSLIPRIQEFLFDIFGKSKVILKKDEDIFKPNLNILTSIARGLAVAGYIDQYGNSSISVDDIVTHDWGFKHGNEIVAIIKKGTKIKDTAHSKLSRNTGCYCDIRKVHPDAKSFVVDVMCDDTFCGQITIPESTSKEYGLYYVIDPQKGWLILDIYIKDSNQWFDDMSMENRKINYININGGHSNE